MFLFVVGLESSKNRFSTLNLRIILKPPMSLKGGDPTMPKPDNRDLCKLLGKNVMVSNPDPSPKNDPPDKPEVFSDTAKRDEERQTNPLRFKILSLGIGIVAVVALGALTLGLWGKFTESVAPEPGPSKEELALKALQKTRADVPSLVKAYLAATTIEEKLKYVRQPERVEPLMRDWYEEKKHPMEAKEVDAQMILSPNTLFGKSFWKAEMNEGGMFMKQLWIQSYEDGSHAIDWETDVVYNPMHWDTFLAEKPTTPVTLRVYVGWDNLYLYQHRDEEKFQSFKLESRDSEQTATAYMDRADKGMQIMMFFIQRSAKDPKDLRTALTLPFLVTLKYDESPEGKKNLVIEKLDSPSWIVFEEKDQDKEEDQAVNP